MSAASAVLFVGIDLVCCCCLPIMTAVSLDGLFFLLGAASLLPAVVVVVAVAVALLCLDEDEDEDVEDDVDEETEETDERC